MSTELESIHTVDNNGISCGIYLTSFYCGDNRGACLQLTVSTNAGTEHAQLTHDDAEKLNRIISEWLGNARAAQLEAERDAVLERERIELIEWAARSNEQFALRQQTQLELDTARAAIVRYQDERVKLLDRLEALVAEMRANP